MPGMAVHLYAANRSMERFFYDADGELLLVPQQGRLRLATELGRLDVAPGEIAVIPRGIRFRVELVDGDRAWLRLRELRGAVPAAGSGADRQQRPRQSARLPHARSPGTRTARASFELVAKFQGHLWRAASITRRSTSWPGTATTSPYKYDLARFNAIGSISFDHPDPSIFLVLQSPTDTPGVDTIDFVIFPPRILAMEHTFRPPWFHRNVASEFMGLDATGVYDAKAEGFVPGGASLHNCMSGHGPDADTFAKASRRRPRAAHAHPRHAGLHVRVAARDRAHAPRARVGATAARVLPLLGGIEEKLRSRTSLAGARRLEGYSITPAVPRRSLARRARLASLAYENRAPRMALHAGKSRRGSGAGAGRFRPLGTPFPTMTLASAVARAMTRHSRSANIRLSPPPGTRLDTPMPETRYDNLLTETRDRVAIITLNRPKALNALSDPLAAELATALSGFDADPGISVIVITGSEKAFAAGADIGAMAEWDYQKVYLDDYITKNFEAVRHTRKPVIAAVAGYALGGGNELAMMCDMIIAADTAKFGQPEITIGTMPGLGGTQRLPRAVGKAKAMDLCLTGRMLDAEEAERSGLVARVVPADRLLEETMAVANKIASFSLPVILKIKESVNRAFESSLAEGLMSERREFHGTFGLEDQKEGMRAFVAKRKPAFRHR